MLFTFVYYLVFLAMHLWHPVFHVRGRENLPKEGSCIICCNHSSRADPIWLLFAMKTNRRERVPRIMAKAQLMNFPVLRRIFQWIGMFGVDRGNNDIAALKTAIKTLKEGKSLMIFPQGTRCRNGDRLPGKTGVAMLATRNDTMVLPMYLTEKKRPFCPLTCVIGEPYRMEFEGKRATSAELHQLTENLMDRIYALGEQA